MYVYVPHMCPVPTEARKRVSDSLDLELETAGRDLVAAGNWSQDLWKSNKPLHL